MTKQDVLYLIQERPGEHGVFDQHVEKRRMVYCEVRSVGFSEFYRAREHGMNPTYIFILADEAEWRGEKICEYQGKRYRVVRTYMDRQRLELTVEEATIDG